MYALASVLQGLVSVPIMVLIGQGLVSLVAGKRRRENVVWRLFDVVLRPIYRAVRAITPRLVVDAHIPLVSFLLLCWLYLFLTQARIYYATGLWPSIPTVVLAIFQKAFG